jgi:hypothetical protein
MQQLAITKNLNGTQVKSKSILFLYTSFHSFVRNDYEILSKEYEVKKHQFKPVRGLVLTGLEMIKQFFYLLFNIWKYDAVYVWFADYHSLLPVLFAKVLKKKSYVVIGGYDICRDRQLSYGSFYSSFRGFFSAQSIRNCSINITVSNYVDRKVGFVFPKVRHEMIYNCINLDSPVESVIEKEKLILCVALIESRRTYMRKGIDTFLALAPLLRDYKFVLIGPDSSAMSLFSDLIPANVSIFQRLPQADLLEYFQKASFYCQLSRVETFGVAIGEAMLYRCIPLVTNEGGMPEVVGNIGRIVPRDPKIIADLIRGIQASDTSPVRETCRKHIITNFSFDMRKKSLLKLMSRK